MISKKDVETLLRKSQPLIIIGMHRSGTSLVVRLLNDIGIEMGINLSRDAESIFFQKINRRIYKYADSDWGKIDILLSLMEERSFIDAQTEKVLKTLFFNVNILGIDSGIANHFGQSKYSSLIHGEPLWWGWKDPRTTLTFPIWLKIFPKARILHVLRNGIDVAISTHRRSKKQQAKFWKRLMPLDFISETLDFNYCYSLWEKYVSFVIKNKDLIPPTNYMEIQYEELLSQPIEKIKNITNFIGYPIQDALIEKACQQIDRSRRDNSYYQRIYHKEIMQLTSYDLLNHLGYRNPKYSDFDEVAIGS